MTDKQAKPFNRPEDRQRIKEIEADLKASLVMFANPSTSTMQNVDPAENMNEQNSFELIDNSSLMTSGYDSMDVDDHEKILEEKSSNDEQRSDTVDQNNDITTKGEKQTNLFEYLRQLQQLLALVISLREPVLVQFGIPSKTTEDFFENVRFPPFDPSNTIDPDLPNKMLIPLQKGIDLLPSFRRLLNTDNADHGDTIGEQSNENRTTSAPSENNKDNLDQNIQASTQSKLPTSTIPKDDNTKALSSSLSRLLSRAKVIQELNLTTLEITSQPREFWTRRTINCLENKWNVCIQDRSGEQQHYPRIEWSKFTTNDRKKLFVLVQVLRWDGLLHEFNIIVPPGTTIKRPEQSNTKVSAGEINQRREPSRKRKKILKRRLTLEDLIIENGYAFDARNRAILCPVTDLEYKPCAKSLQLIMFSLYTTSEEAADVNGAENSIENNKNEMDTDSDGENELRKLSILRIRLCEQTDNEEFRYISNSVDTEPILQCIGSTLKKLAIDGEKVTPKCLCSCGNDIITLPLNKNTDGKGFVIRLDGQIQSDDKFQVKKDQILVSSRPITFPGQNYLKVELSKKCILETIKQKKKPSGGLVELKISEIYIPFVEHSENPHKHENINTEAFYLVQPNEMDETRSILQ